jgi:hypothetical protein
MKTKVLQQHVFKPHAVPPFFILSAPPFSAIPAHALWLANVKTQSNMGINMATHMESYTKLEMHSVI